MGEHGLMILVCILTYALAVNVWINDDRKSVLKAGFVGCTCGLTTAALIMTIRSLWQ